MKRKVIPPPDHDDSVRPCRLLIRRASQDKREPRHHHRDTANRRELAELAVAAERVRVAGAREEERPGCEESSGERRPLERRRERQHRTVDHVVLVGVLKCNLAVGVNFESMRAVSSEPNGGAAGDPGDAHDDGGSAEVSCHQESTQNINTGIDHFLVSTVGTYRGMCAFTGILYHQLLPGAVGRAYGDGEGAFRVGVGVRASAR